MIFIVEHSVLVQFSKNRILIYENAGKGIRAPARLRVAVFETAALPLGYPGI